MENKVYKFDAPSYSLEVDGHLVRVLLEGVPAATLDVRTSVPKTNDTCDGFVADTESAPSLVKAELSAGRAEFVWEGKSDLWEKKYTLKADSLRFRYYVTVRGHGKVDAVKYFSGEGFGSDYEFTDGFTPCVSWYNNEDYHFRVSAGCHRWSVLMIPPMFCYSYRTERIGTRLGLGLVAERGEHNFHAFDSKAGQGDSFKTGFWLETDQAGHVTVDGEWTAPYIIGFSADDDVDVMRRYSNYYYSSGIAELPQRASRPRFWYGPMVCGWIEQMILDRNGEYPDAGDCANEKVYDSIAERIKKYSLKPTCLIIDDKWADSYTLGEADKSKFPDMRAYVERRRKEGIRTLLWFKLWDAETWDEDKCLTDKNGSKYLDPSHPDFKALLKERMHLYLSSDEGCYNCDGFKLDFAFWNPIGRGVKTYSGKYGVELMYEMMCDIYEAAKAEKPDCLINNSACHPYFAHICDQARLHDYDGKNRDNKTDLVLRAKMYEAAMPGVLIDTDNAAFYSHRDTMHWLMEQDLVGVPDLYSTVTSDGSRLTEDDFFAISDMWAEYRTLTDGMYGKDEVI